MTTEPDHSIAARAPRAGAPRHPDLIAALAAQGAALPQANPQSWIGQC